MRKALNVGNLVVAAFILTLLAAVQVMAAGERQTVSVPSRQTGLWITAICGKGCEAINGALDVYVLTESEYTAQKENRDAKTPPNGKTPLLLTDVTPGVYYIGIRCIVDTSIVQLKQSRFPAASRPAYDEFFVDDLPDEAESVVFTGDTPEPGKGFLVNYALRKWYKVKVSESVLTPVVGIFLGKQTDPQKWVQYYPKAKLFNVTLPPKNQEEVWKALDLPGKSAPTLSTDNRKVLGDLLLRGGRVCLPSPHRGVVWVTGEGLLNAVQKIPSEKIADRLEATTTVSSLTRSVATGTAESKAGSDALPKFQDEIPKGPNEIRITNPNEFSVTVGLRSTGKGRDFAVGEKGSTSNLVPDGTYEIYFVYSTEPKALYRGDTFSLRRNGVEIQIVRVVNGNYAIRRVK